MASEQAKRLRDSRLNLWNEAKGILDTAATENREMTPDEETRYDALHGEIGKKDEQIKNVLDAEQRSKEADDAFNQMETRRVDRGSHGRGAHGINIDEFRTWMNTGQQGNDPNPKAFNIVRGSHQPLELRTLMSVGGSASATVPIDFYDQLIAYLIEVSGILQTGPSVLNTAGGETLQIPTVASHIAAASAAQAGTLPSSDPTFALKTLASVKFADITYIARELIDDTAVDLLGYIAMAAGRAVGNLFGNALVNGTQGITGGLLSASVSVTGTNTSAQPSGQGMVTGGPSYGNLVDLEYSVIAPYRQSRSCYWLAADATIGTLRKLTDTVGRPVWEPSAVLGSPDLLLGKPLVADPFMPALATGAKSIAFGDFSQYFVRLVGGLRFERSDDFQFGNDVVAFRVVLRGDGNLADTNAIKLFQGGAQ